MKTIVITGIGDTRNNGCWAMAASAMTSIREASSVPVRFIILNRKGSVDTERLAFENVQFISWPWSLLTIPRLRLLGFFISAVVVVLQACLLRILPNPLIFRKYWRAMREADLILDLSGDSIGSAYSWVANLASIFPLLITWLIGKPYYLCAQSIGPFGTGIVDRLVIFLLRSASLITVRESRTTQILKDLGIRNNVRRTEDLAFLLVPSSEEERTSILGKEDINPGQKWIGVSVSSIIASYAFSDLCGADREEAYLSSLANFCDNLYEEYGYHSLFVPHVTIPNIIDDDRSVTAKVKNRMRHGDTCRILDGEYTAAQLKAVIGVCSFFFGSRMHATIGALSQGIPTLTLVYNHKTLGINGDVLGQHDYMIDIRHVSSVSFGSDLSACFTRLVANADAVRAKLLSILPSIREGALENAWLAVDFLDVAGPLQGMHHPLHCSGCGTCAGVCPSRSLEMRETPQGTLRPGLRRHCSGCRRCDKVCPSHGFDLAVAQKARFNALGNGDLGVCASTRTGHASDHQVRFNGSSGGLVTAVASFLLTSRRVDAVLVVAADLENPFVQRAHWVTEAKELKTAQGSRYLPTAVNDAFANIPDNAQRLAVVGLPCHLWGVHLLEKSGVLGSRTIDWRLGLFCGRTPSLHAADTMLTGLGSTRPETSRFSFRGEGWPGISCVSTAVGDFRMPLDKMWEFIGSPFFTPPHCFSCPDFSGYLSDISFGDAWLAECRGDNIGTSLVLARSEREVALLDEMILEGQIVMRDVEPQLVEAAFTANIQRKQRHSGTKALICGWAFPVVCGSAHDGDARTFVKYWYEWHLSLIGATPVLRKFFVKYPSSRRMRLLRRLALCLQGGR